MYRGPRKIWANSRARPAGACCLPVAGTEHETCSYTRRLMLLRGLPGRTRRHRM